MRQIRELRKYFVLKLTHHERVILATDLEDARVLKFDTETGTCSDPDLGTVGLLRDVIDGSFCEAVKAVVKKHASNFCDWAHDQRFNRYMKKLTIQAEGMEPFPRMRGRAETNADEKDVALRRSKVLHTKDHKHLAALVDKLYGIVTDLRPAHLADAPGADTRYPVTIGVCGTHIMPHSDEPEYDGPGAEIYNFIICGQGLAALSLSFHKTED